jgi:archaellin
MAIFEDVNGKAQVVSTDAAVTHTEGRGASSSWSHEGAGKHTDNHFNTMQSVSDDGHGHRSETFTKTTEVVTHDAKTHQVHTDIVSQSVTKELAAGQAAVDLSKVMDEHSDGSTIAGLTYRNEHKQSTATESGRVLSEQHDVVAWDKVGNRESYGGGHNSSGDSWASIGGGLGVQHSFGVAQSSGAQHSDSFGSSVSMGSGVGHGHSAGGSLSSGHSSQSSEGLSAHVSDSLVHHLVSHGYSAHEAQQTVQGVSHTLSQEVNGHTMGNAGSVEFHKEGPVAVSLSNENTASSGHTLSVAMDALKAVHESGMSQNLDAVQSHRNAPQAPQAVAELSR